jgi:two-component system NtrC family sensor kinase
MPTVVYVDDEPINLRVFEANFRSRFRILTFREGAEALAAVTAEPSGIAVLISDQRMPGMTGVELLERARQVAPDVRRMLITAYSDIQAVMDAVNRGQVIRYFVKPWVREDLAAALEDAVGIWSLQRRLAEIEARMLRSERLAALGQVSAGVAHELMNPVSYMTQNVSTLRRELDILAAWVRAHRTAGAKGDAEVTQVLEDLPSLLADVETGARHIRQVALGIRSQARGEDVERACNVTEVAEYAARIARVQLRERARIQLRGTPERVAMGPVKLGQVLMNLLVNAAQALEEVERPGLVEVHWRADADALRVEVCDNGPGMTPEVQARVFEPLFTTKAAGTGTGLGLPICREIVTEAGGTLTLSSTPGTGTVVTFTLPLAGP